jgi:thiamine kinase-like enzyme
VNEQQLIELIPELRGRPLTVSPLGGGLTNHNFRIDADDGSYVLRVAGAGTALLGINRDCEVACSRAAAALGVGPEVIAYLPEHGAMVRRFVSGRALTPDGLRQPTVLRRVLEALRHYHNGPPGAGSFSAFGTVRHYYSLARERRVAFGEGLERALELLDRIEEQLRDVEAPRPCHNDLLAGNFIDDGAALRIIDWEYGGMGDRFFDLGNLAANNEFEEGHERALLAFYFGEVRPGQLKRLHLMRMASDLREAMWGYLQSALSTLEVDYVAYARKHLERFIDTARRTESGFNPSPNR